VNTAGGGISGAPRIAPAWDAIEPANQRRGPAHHAKKHPPGQQTPSAAPLSPAG